MSIVKESKTDRIFNFVNFIFLGLILLVTLYPIIFVISASVSDPDLINAGKVWLLPKGLNFDGYRRVAQYNEIWVGYRNTIFYTLFGTAINLFVTLPAAYALSRKDFIGRNFFTAIFTFTMFFSGGLVPNYMLVKGLGMRNSIWAVLIPSAASMTNIIISRTFFQNSIPDGLKEAAEIDGCSNTRLFLNIILPLSAPIIAVMALYYSVGHWNSYFSAMIYLSDRRLFPLQVILREILVQNQLNSEMLKDGEDLDYIARQMKVADLIKYAVIIVSTLPIMALYPFIQKYFVKGVMIGAIKG